MLVDLFEQLLPINVAVLDLQTFAINIFGICSVQVGRERQDLIEELTEWNV